MLDTMLPYKDTSIHKARWVALTLSLIAIVLGVLHTWAAVTNYSMNADGISYLDIGDAYLRGDWQNAINPVWSPMYSWILGIVMRLFQPSMRWEFPLVQIVNFFIYLMAFASFTYFWQQAWNYLRTRLANEKIAASISLPDWAFQAIGYLVFIWASLTLIEIWAVTPDMLMAAILFLAAALILRMRISAQGWAAYALLGFILGLGYLTKTIMFPVSFLFLGASLFSAGGIRWTAPRAVLSAAIFALIVTPFIILISRNQGYITYGESGQITYMRYVNGAPYPHWQGELPDFGTPIHPSRKIFDNPAIYEFATPVSGTYPITYDPSYWYEGIQLRVSLSEILPAVLSNSLVYFDLLLRQLGSIAAAILILYLIGIRRSSSLFQRLRSWSLAVISILVSLMYALVYVEGRYIAVFVILLLADLLVNLSLPDSQTNRKMITVSSLVMILSLVASLIAYNLEGFIGLTSRPSSSIAVQSAPSPRWPGQVAEELHRLGINPGDQVGVIGYAFDSYWARLARVKIVAEMFEWEADPFYLGTSEFQSKVIRVFANVGVSAIIAEHVPDYANLDGWHQVGNTNYYIFRLN